MVKRTPEEEELRFFAAQDRAADAEALKSAGDRLRISSTPECVSISFHRCVAEASNMGDYWYINRVLVMPPEIRGRGMGQLLVETLCIEVRKQGGKKIVVTPGGYTYNTARQIRFYKICGFVEDENEAGLLYRSPARRR